VFIFLKSDESFLLLQLSLPVGDKPLYDDGVGVKGIGVKRVGVKGVGVKRVGIKGVGVSFFKSEESFLLLQLSLPVGDKPL
jgi:hypothetical protein